MTIDDFRELFRQGLSGFSEPEEVENLCFLTLEHILKKSRVEVSLSRKQKLSDTQQIQLLQTLERLKKSEPIQYIIGSTEFYGLEFQVNRATLIPRPETEELVEWVVNEVQSANKEALGQSQSIIKNQNIGSRQLQLLDVGTGSGCIAISLARHLENVTVEAIDISTEALATAHQNAIHNNVKVTFYHKDILETQRLDVKYDVIVSNPPYVRELEKEEMRANVLDNEPARALFVSNGDPLIFYKKIGELAFDSLSDNGMLFFEINEYLGGETVQLLKDIGFTDVVLRQDMFGKDRMIRALR